MSYIYGNELFFNIFELLDTKFPNNSITTVALVGEDGNKIYDNETLKIIKNFDDDIFFDTRLKKVYSPKKFYKQYNIRETTAEDFKLIYGF